MTSLVNRFQKINFLPLLLALFVMFTNVHASEKQEPCEGWLRQTGARISQGWRQFRQEVREQGKIRYVLAPRHDGARFNGWAAFLDPLIDLPIETYSYVSAKYFDRPLQRRLSIFTSIPAGLVVWGSLFVGLDLKADQWALEGLDQSVSQDVSGAGYAAEYVLSGAIAPGEGMRILERHHTEGVHGLDNLRMRAEQFQRLNIWRPEQVQELKKVLDEIRANHSPAEIAKRADLEMVLRSNSAFQSFMRTIPEASRYTAKLLIEPRVTLQGRPDAYWLSIFFEPFRYPHLTPAQMKGLASLESIYKFHSRDLSLATMSYLIAETLGNPAAMNAKINEAAKLILDRDLNFIYRGNVPLFSQPGEFVDLDRKVPLHSELDRWNLLLKDPRFQLIRRDWERKEISELTALLRTDVQARALSQIYQMAVLDQKKLSEENACTLIFGNPEKGDQEALAPNPLFVRLMQAPPQLQYPLAQNYFSALVEVGEYRTAAGYEAALTRALALERAILNGGAVQGVLTGLAPLDCLRQKSKE